MKRTENENWIIKMIKEMEKYHCVTVNIEDGENGQCAYHLDKGEAFKQEAYDVFNYFITRVCRQKTVMKIGHFCHVNWILDTIAVNFWDCE